MKHPINSTSSAAIHLQIAGESRLTAAEFQILAEAPAAVEWFANIDNPRTRRSYQSDLGTSAVLSACLPQKNFEW